MKNDSNSIKWPVITESCIENVNCVLKSGILTTKNKRYDLENSFQEQFTRQFCDFLNAPYGKVVPNGTIALVIALLSLGVKENDYVLVSENTWIASISAITLINAIPVLVPCKIGNLLIDCESIIKLQRKYKPKAIIIVHLNGFLQDYSKILHDLKVHNVKVIEDCAQAIGSEYKNIKAGTFGDIGAFSFQESKVLTCGEGGFLCTKDIAIYRRICLYQDLTYAQKIPMGNNEMYLFGSNYRVTEQQCALLYSQFKNVFLASITEKDIWAKKIINLLNFQKNVRSVDIDRNQTVLSLFKIPVIFYSINEKEKFLSFLEKNSFSYYNGGKPLYLTNIFSTGRKSLKKMHYKRQKFNDYNIQINQVGIFHYYFNQNTYELLKNYFTKNDINNSEDGYENNSYFIKKQL